jgi:hypothetical protein
MSPAVSGVVRSLLRAEGFFELLVLGAAYAQWGHGWWLFGGLFLAPDLAMLGYFAGPRIGAVCYNAAHVIVGPVLLGTASLLAGWPLGVSLALIWAAHIQFDRAIGYGLKYASGFGHTHLGSIGKTA